MGLRDLRHRLTASIEELDAHRLQDRYRGLGLTPLAAAPCREPIRVGGEITRIRVVPRDGSPSLEVTVNDGTGEAVAIFLGRRSLGGCEHGRGLLLEGVAHTERGRPVLLNPSYTLLPRG